MAAEKRDLQALFRPKVKAAFKKVEYAVNDLAIAQREFLQAQKNWNEQRIYILDRDITREKRENSLRTKMKKIENSAEKVIQAEGELPEIAFALIPEFARLSIKCMKGNPVSEEFSNSAFVEFKAVLKQELERYSSLKAKTVVKPELKHQSLDFNKETYRLFDNELDQQLRNISSPTSTIASSPSVSPPTPVGAAAPASASAETDVRSSTATASTTSSVSGEGESAGIHTKQAISDSAAAPPAEPAAATPLKAPPTWSMWSQIGRPVPGDPSINSVVSSAAKH